MKSSRWRWHLDEMFVKINGEMHYLWRAVDHEGEVLESFDTTTRDKKAALKFLKKAMRRALSEERSLRWVKGLRSLGPWPNVPLSNTSKPVPRSSALR